MSELPSGPPGCPHPYDDRKRLESISLLATTPFDEPIIVAIRSVGSGEIRFPTKANVTSHRIRKSQPDWYGAITRALVKDPVFPAFEVAVIDFAAAR